MLPYNQIVCVPVVVRLRLKVSSGVASGVAHAVDAELAILAVTGEPGSVTTAAALELAADAETEPTEAPPVKEDVPVAGTLVADGPVEPGDDVEVIWLPDEPVADVDFEDVEVVEEEPNEDEEVVFVWIFDEDDEVLEGKSEDDEEEEDRDEVRVVEELELEVEEVRVAEVEVRAVEEELDEVEDWPLDEVEELTMVFWL